MRCSPKSTLGLYASSIPAEHFSSARSIACNRLCGVWSEQGKDKGTYTEKGINALCEGLKGSAVTSLECAAAPNLHADCTQCHCPADPQKCSAPDERLH